MEEVDECLTIANIEISCWKEQLKEAVSQSHIHWSISMQIWSFFVSDFGYF